MRDLTNIESVAEVEGEEAANTLLEAGWQMLAVCRKQNGGRVFSLGRSRRTGQKPAPLRERFG